MGRKTGRFLTFVLGGAVAAWWLRLVAHSKTPPPEGRWREDPSIGGGAK